MNYAQTAVFHRKYSNFIKTYSELDEKENIFLYTGFDFDMVLEEKEIKLQQDGFLLLSYNQKLLPISIDSVYL